MIEELEKTLKIAGNRLRNRFEESLISKNISENHRNRILKDLDKSNIFSFDVIKFLEEDELPENNEYHKIKFIDKKEEKMNQNIYGRSLLHEAVIKKDEENIKILLTNKMYVDSIDNNNHTPYEMAVFLGYKEIVELFDKFK